MKKSDTTIVIIDDDIRFKEDPFIVEIEMKFEKIFFFEDPISGLDFIEQNLQENIIVILDLAFPNNMPDGHKILERIREWTYLIPVIIWSGRDEDKETFSDLINHKAFAYLKKSASTEEMINTLLKAENYLNSDVSGALEDWINSHSDEDKHKPFIATVEGKQISLNDILKEIRLQTPDGRDFSKRLVKLTIDLLNRKKEKL